MYYLMLFVLAVWVKRYLTALVRTRSVPLAAPGLLVPLPSPPLVSVILAARNEEAAIGECLRSLSAGRYAPYEIIVADDRSTDATGEIIRREFPSVVCVTVSSLPRACAGKTHALSLARKRARGEWLLFTDADTEHTPFSIAVPLRYAMENGVDMLSILTHPVSRTFSEKCVQPLICLLLFLLFPLEKINNRRSATAFANGQYILIRRGAYERIGGHEALLGYPLEDIAMARRAKGAGLNVQLLFGGHLVRCRMYRGLRELWTGWERIFFLIFNDSIWMLPAVAALVSLYSLLPYAGLLLFPRLAVAQLIFLHLSLERTYAYIGADRRAIVTHPLGCLAVIGILLGAFVKKVLRRGVMWRGKRYYRWCENAER